MATASELDHQDEFEISQRIVISFGKGKHWVPDTQVVDDTTFVKLSSCGMLAQFCGLRPAMKDACDDPSYISRPWGGNSFMPWLRSHHKSAVDDALVELVRARNNEPSMGLPKLFRRTKEKAALKSQVVSVMLPEVAFEGALCEAMTVKMLGELDNRQCMHMELSEESLRWIRVAVKAQCPDNDAVEPTESPAAKRSRRAKSDRIEPPAELKKLVRHIKYDRERVVARYTNADGAEVFHTLKCETWDSAGVADALTKFAEWRVGRHFVKNADGDMVVAPPHSAPDASDAPVDDGGEEAASGADA